VIKWFKKRLTASHAAVSSQLPLRWKRYLRKPAFWDFKRDAVARGVAAGLFAAAIPIMPFQTLLTVLVTILIRGNLAIAFAASWVSNPITLLPLAYLTYHVGNLVMGDKKSIVVTTNFDWHIINIHGYWNGGKAWILQFGKAFFVGLPIVALAMALSGYFLVMIIWHSADLIKKIKQRKNND
jgi:uncharacterized protein